MNDYLLSILFGVVEGLTEFLPVSSTAHLRLVKPPLGVSLESPYWKMYDVVIQLGAILAVVVYFRSRIRTFLSTFPRGAAGDKTAITHPVTLVMLAFVVTAVPAFLLAKVISENLESLWIFAIALLVGGVVMWVVDAWLGDRGATTAVEEMKPWQAVLVGASQVVAAVFPGASRSMSTIVAGQLGGMSRPAALEFSFYLAIPTMMAACCYDLFKSRDVLGEVGGHGWGVLGVGFGVSFLVAWGVIALFMEWVKKRGFVPFAIYRILLGGGLLIWLAAGGGSAAG